MENPAIGVSGLMRVKNEAEFIALSVESCIDALDELIIVFQDCQDNTPQIIDDLVKKYPTKISAYHYIHEIKSHQLNDNEFDIISNLPQNSPELLATYYNFALSKCNYKYALKIDGDQIYNTQKLIKICDAYRSTVKKKISLSEYISGLSLHFLSNINSFINNCLINSWTIPCQGKRIVEKYEQYVIKMINNKKNPTNLNGFNLCFINGQPSLCNGEYGNYGFPPFNGVYDHLIFPVSTDTYFIPNPIKSKHTKYGNCVIERFNYDSKLKLRFGFGWKWKLLQGGFMWFHVAPLKRCNKIEFQSIPFNENISIIKSGTDFKSSLFNSSRFWMLLFYKNYKFCESENINLTKICKIVLKSDNK